MRIKKYRATNFQEGKSKIIEELGEDVVILSTRNVKSPLPNQPEYIEIIAAIEDKPLQNNGDNNNKIKKETLTLQSALKYKEHENEILFVLMQLQEDVNYLKYNMQFITEILKYKYSNILEGDYNRIYKYLRDEGFSEEYAYKIIGQISTNNTKIDLLTLIEKAKDIISKELLIDEPIKHSQKQQIAIFFGPTGSGKTLSLVKLAIINKLLNKINILIISTDTDKVGGSEQLQSFSTIAGISFATAYTPSDLREIIDNNKDKDFIYIDTTGKSHKNNEHFKELNYFIQAANPNFKYLVVSSSTDSLTFDETLLKFSKLEPTGLILSKFDESYSIGGILEILKKYHYKLSFFTTGQKIPEDIEPASKEFISNFVFRKIEL